jgi:hypothetical protein
LHQMKAGGDVERMRCAYVCPWGKRASTGTGTNTDTGMCRKPTCQSHGINARQEVEWSVGAEVNQAGLEVAAFTIGPFVHAKERGGRAFGHRSITDPAQNGGRAEGIPCRCAMRAATAPPTSNPRRRCSVARRIERRAQGATTSGMGSENVRRGQSGWVQTKRRTLRCNRTGTPAQGRSKTVRV